MRRARCVYGRKEGDLRLLLVGREDGSAEVWLRLSEGGWVREELGPGYNGADLRALAGWWGLVPLVRGGRALPRCWR